MAYHHVIAKIVSTDEFCTLFSDLSTAELERCFITPYEQGKLFFSGNDLISPNELRSIQIIRTQRPEQIERDEINRIDRAKIDELNRSSNSGVIVSVGGGYEPQDIAGVGEDITHAVIKGPPGFKAERWAPSMKALGWLFSVIAVIVAAGITKWLGWV